MKHIKTSFIEYINENIEVDKILDKISKRGIDNITDYEKSILDRHSKGEYKFRDKDEELRDYFDKEFSLLHTEPYEEKGLGDKIKSGFHFVDKNAETYFTFEEMVGQRMSNTLFIDEQIFNNIQKRFDVSMDELKEVLVPWLDKRYFDVMISSDCKLSLMFSSI